MKKLYNQPTTEVMYLTTERLMDSIIVSLGTGDEGGAHAPGRGDIIP